MKVSEVVTKHKEEYKIFIRFLKENGIYKAFWRNVLNQKAKKDYENYFFTKYNNSVIEFITRADPNVWIDHGLVWRRQPEGEPFWSKVDSKWNTYLDKKLKNEV
jgi:hypothetical protein